MPGIWGWLGVGNSRDRRSRAWDISPKAILRLVKPCRVDVIVKAETY